jgi:[histone H3]-lysine9 N-trimethyltransferase SUV39H
VNETNIEKPLIVIFTKKDIRPNAELCFSYHGDTNDEETEEAGSVSFELFTQ